MENTPSQLTSPPASNSTIAACSTPISHSLTELHRREVSYNTPYAPHGQDCVCLNIKEYFNIEFSSSSPSFYCSLVTDTVPDLTPEIWSHVRLKRSKDRRRRRNSKRTFTPVFRKAGSSIISDHRKCTGSRTGSVIVGTSVDASGNEGLVKGFTIVASAVFSSARTGKNCQNQFKNTVPLHYLSGKTN
ncbi:hypothetical protein J6590_088936 [Homalodisca vitripennis]|nr:hypothetical protein J6590_088936 [Homalodisca vitripennis]